MQNVLKTYPSSWGGRLLLACKKCQKKLKHKGSFGELSSLKKVVNDHNKRHPKGAREVINVPCMDLCPKGGVTVCDPCEPTRLFILRSVDDLGRL